MAISVLIPSVLKRYTDNLGTVEAAGSNIHELVQDLRSRYPELGGHLLDEEGNLRKFVNIYLGDDNIRHLAAGETPLKDGDVISIVPAVAGGSPLRMITLDDAQKVRGAAKRAQVKGIAELIAESLA